MYRNTVVEVDLGAIASNVQSIKKKFDDYQYVIGVIKGSAYGHGEYIVNTLVKNGVNYVAVSNIAEALAVREFNQTIPILCFLPFDLAHIDVVIKNKLTATVHSLDYAVKLANLKLSSKLKVHIKIDSGMSRLGLTSKEDVKLALEQLRGNKNIEVEGIYTHFATSGIYDPHYKTQVNKFARLTSLISLKDIPIVHADRSLTAMAHHRLPFANGLRVGIAMYGYNQLPKASSGLRPTLRRIKNEIRAKLNNVNDVSLTYDISLKPALKMFSEVIQVKKVPAGSIVGYGESYITKEDSTLAVIAAGYADGIDLRRSGGAVAINSKRFKIIGTVNMNSIIAKVDESVKAGDRVELIGDSITMREVSSQIGTTIYETMTSIPPNVARKYVKNGKSVYVSNQ